MIRFVCTCGHRFEVDDEQGGGAIQCPDCRRLSDIPTLQDLASFTNEGTYVLDADHGPAADDPDRMADLAIIYAKDKRDAEGNEIDLRTLPGGRPLGQGLDDGAGDLELKPFEPNVGDRPRYDPETGELIRPLDVRKDPEREVDPTAIPMAKATISYASGDLSRRLNPLRIAIELFMPLNLVVMFFVFVTHLFSAVMFTVMLGLMPFLILAWLVLQALILSHYGNVIDDTGRNEQEDLPRPLRNLSWHDDISSPFIGMFLGFALSLVIPTLAFVAIGHRVGLPPRTMLAAGAIIGTIIGPAILLTSATSGSMLNLRPDRVFHVIRIVGLHYIGLVGLFAITWPVYGLGWFGFCLDLLGLVSDRGAITTLITGPALVLGIYLMHYFCWYLGLMYRAHHDEFPWVLQRFVRDPSASPRTTHANKLGRRRPMPGHLAHIPSSLPPPPPPPPPASRV